MGLKNPIIIYDLCEECGKCIEKCEHGVFGKEPSKRPDVKNPDACIDDCYGCSDVCPVSAVMFFGKFGEESRGVCGKSGGCGGCNGCGNHYAPKDDD